MIKQKKLLIIFFLTTICLLIIFDHNFYGESRDQNTPRIVAKKFISALETKDFGYIFGDLYDKEALDEIVKEKQTNIKGLINEAGKIPLKKELIDGLKRAIQTPPKERQIHLINGKVQKIIEFREEKGIIEKNSETGSTIYQTYYIYLVKRSNNYFIYQFGAGGPVVGPFSKIKSDSDLQKHNTEFLYIKIPENILPLDRYEKYEIPLDDLLRKAKLGEVTGGGTALSSIKGIEYIGIDIDVIDSKRAIPLLIKKLRELKAPKGTVIEKYKPKKKVYSIW